MTRFDHTSLVLFLLSYWNLGFLILVILEMKDFCKNYLQVEPSSLQTVSAILMLPWSFKVIYAMLSDSVPILGFRRKYYLIFNGFISFFSCALIFPDYFHHLVYVVAFLTVCQMAAASTDIIVDSIMVKEAKKDPERGSEDLNSISVLTMGVAGVAGAIIGAFFTQYVHPKWGILLYSMVGLSIFLGALKFNEEKVRHQVGLDSLKGSLRQMKEAVKSPIITNMLWFQFLTGAVVPRFQEFKYFFLLDVVLMPEFNYALLFILSSISLIGLTLIFHYVFKHYSYRQGFAIAFMITTLTTVTDIIFVMGLHRRFYINDYVFLLCTNLFEDMLSNRYTIICAGVVHMRIAPQAVEATVLALLAGASNLGFGVVGPIFGNFWAYMLGLSSRNLGDLYVALVIKLLFSLVPLLFLGFVPNKEDIDKDEDLKRLNAAEESKKHLLV